MFNVNTGGTFLNGIATDGMFIYVTDFNGDKIFKVDVDAATSSTLVANTNGTPNGIVHDPDTDLLWVAFWGANAPVKAYELDGTPGQTFATTLSNIDGITRDCFGNLYPRIMDAGCDYAPGDRQWNTDQYGLDSSESCGY
ncbi:MAG: hypothetical protein IPI91_11735 [Flavobacteriales bacterium]|nr:hypothetical protein [Flavobacteriales bacterium]